MGEVLNEAQIWERYPNEWVLVGDVKTDEWLKIAAGVVLFHSLDRDEVHRRMLENTPPSFAVLYTGPGPEHCWINYGLFF